MITYRWSFKSLKDAEEYLDTLSNKDKFEIAELCAPTKGWPKSGKNSTYFLAPKVLGKGNSFAHSGDDGYKYFVGFNYLNDPDVKDLGIGFRFRFKSFCMIFVTRKDWFGFPKITFYNYYKA